MSEAAAVARAEALMADGHIDQALALTESMATTAQPTHLALAVHSGALKLAGRSPEALDFDRQAIERFGESPIAWHNYAATLDDLGRADEAVEACETAFRRGMDAAQTFAVYARALRAVGNHERADYAYRQSLMRAPAEVGVASEFANHLWMITGDLKVADSALDAAFHAGAPPTPLLIAKATLYEAAGDSERAYSLMEKASDRLTDDAYAHMAAVEYALRLNRLDAAEAFQRRAEAAEPRSRSVIQYSAIVDLAAGRPAEAFRKLQGALKDHPNDQSLWGWMAVAARAVGDPLYARLCDYEQMVGVYDLEAPSGWPSLEAFLADLAKELKAAHVYRQHPTNQSMRHGSQTMHMLSGSNAAPIKAFFEAVDKPIREHMARLGQGDDPLRRRNTFDHRMVGAWSVRLTPNGYHRDHFHPDGWLSSAFYVETPDAALDTEERQGWIRFGQPPFFTSPPLPAERYVRPKPGRLVLFPSYMWHGTVPFTTDEARMSIAFDVVPK
ncbi:putative 2OG-Fe(II) oxygenase [Phenylobacterium sp.]|uniref:putative 2OG-Fe(II) oxygenase n=1 Tax=Phenylobacterium sp. TaxID=1871053 RepID=UPI002B63C52A|nr:putative 2OG-Fe(II) oxygenase [Phenylobacterium sp.]HLZ77561.1 putative 2OG-Fe(II) oxygenase [Phenylobacterium sp.]